MRQLKHHEKKLLKKVDFLNVSPVGAMVHHTLSASGIVLFRLSSRFHSEPAHGLPSQRSP